MTLAPLKQEIWFGMKLFTICLLAAVVWTAGVDAASARTWYVELDGSGDFDDIQPAVDVSAAGDTIRIGPGRFDTFHPCVAPAWTEDAIVAVTQDNLTFIGSGKGVTILGTSTYYGTPTTSPKVFCSVDPYDCSIKDMTIENVEQGIYWWRGSLTVEGCVIKAFHNDFIGIFGSLDGGVVRNCEFEFSSVGRGAILHNTFQGFTFQDCVFRGFGFGIKAANGSKNIDIAGCEFEDSYVGIVYDGQSTGTVNDCILQNISFDGVSISGDSDVVCDSVFIDGPEIGVTVTGSSTFIGSNMIIENTTESGIRIFLQGIATLHNSHILPASGLAVNCFAYPGTYNVLDLTENYWGTTDPAEIALMINDLKDDPEVHCTVNFVPFADGPVPTEATSWGSVKSMFR